jgi:hypothetical protein
MLAWQLIVQVIYFAAESLKTMQKQTNSRSCSGKENGLTKREFAWVDWVNA